MFIEKANYSLSKIEIMILSNSCNNRKTFAFLRKSSGFFFFVWMNSFWNLFNLCSVLWVCVWRNWLLRKSCKLCDVDKISQITALGFHASNFCNGLNGTFNFPAHWLRFGKLLLLRFSPCLQKMECHCLLPFYTKTGKEYLSKRVHKKKQLLAKSLQLIPSIHFPSQSHCAC